MTRRFWAGVMLVSLLTAAGSAAFLYKTLADKSGTTVPLKPSPAVPAPDVKPAEPAVEAPPVVKAPAPTLEENRNILFTYANSKAKTVFITGDLTDHQKQPLTKKGNKWSIHLNLKPGTYSYLFVVNGKNTKDPFNKKVVDGKSVITVNPKAH